jgi:indole-3-glycerol phosphate synthase
MFLEQMKALKQKGLQQLQEKYRVSDWDVATSLPTGRSLRQAIENTSFAIIAEVKPASPSKGVIAVDIDPVKQALHYEQGGASVISVLTEPEYFHGMPESLALVKEAVSLPVLRKDFILDPLHVLESKLLGADAILLIIAFLEQESCAHLAQLAHQLGMEVLVEIHDESEVETAMNVGADVIGINNRNLATLQVDLATTTRLRPLLPSDVIVIGESGVHSPADAGKLASAGVDAVLVGEYLMQHANPSKAVQDLKVAGEQQLTKFI